jgi:hypothetical protein
MTHSTKATECAAMIDRCPDCGKDLSTEAQACPHCGKPVSKPLETTAKVVFGIIGGILLAIRYHSRFRARRLSAAIGHVTAIGGPFL